MTAEERNRIEELYPPLPFKKKIICSLCKELLCLSQSTLQCLLGMSKLTGICRCRLAQLTSSSRAGAEEAQGCIYAASAWGTAEQRIHGDRQLTEMCKG